MGPFLRNEMEPESVAERQEWGKLSLRGWFFRRAVNTIRLAFQLHDRGAVYDAVQERHRQRCVAEIVGPGFEVDVRHERRAGALAARVDDLVPQAGGLRTDRAFDAVEAEFVDDEQVELGVKADTVVDGGGGPGR